MLYIGELDELGESARDRGLRDGRARLPGELGKGE
jgi:hypothetical protein